MKELKQQFKEKLLSIGREGMGAVIENLEELGFFEAPASTKFHLNVKGGIWNTPGTYVIQRSCFVNR